MFDKAARKSTKESRCGGHALADPNELVSIKMYPCKKIILNDYVLTNVKI